MTDTHRRRFLTHAGVFAGVGLAIARPFRLSAAEEPRPLVILFFGNALPEVQKGLGKEYLLKPLKAGSVPRKKDTDNVAGLEQLATADLWVGSTNKRTFPSEAQLGHFQKFYRAGKPVVGYRAASHVFQNWLAVDKEVFGAKYGGHHLLGKEKDLVIQVEKGAKDHPILAGLTVPPPRSGSYRYTELADDVRVLLRSGRGNDLQPHTWIRENARTKGRVFYTRYDAKEIAGNPVVTEIFQRGILWALNRDMKRHRKSS